jgi:hypothetical protein
MIGGVHTIFYSKQADAVRAFFRDVLEFSSVDAGRGWLIFAAPPGELAIHPCAERGHHELYLMCSDVQAEVARLQAKGVDFPEPIRDQGWGLLTKLKLPDGETLGLYQRSRSKSDEKVNRKETRPSTSEKDVPKAQTPPLILLHSHAQICTEDCGETSCQRFTRGIQSRQIEPGSPKTSRRNQTGGAGIARFTRPQFFSAASFALPQRNLIAIFLPSILTRPASHFSTVMHRFSQKILERLLANLSDREYSDARLSRGASKTSRRN